MRVLRFDGYQSWFHGRTLRGVVVFLAIVCIMAGNPSHATVYYNPKEIIYEAPHAYRSRDSFTRHDPPRG